MADLIVKRMKDDTEVHRVKLASLSEAHVETVMMGMLRNMDLDNFYIDDSEVDEARKRQRKENTGDETKD